MYPPAVLFALQFEVDSWSDVNWGKEMLFLILKSKEINAQTPGLLVHPLFVFKEAHFPKTVSKNLKGATRA
jgi:hypothetical protein